MDDEFAVESFLRVVWSEVLVNKAVMLKKFSNFFLHFLLQFWVHKKAGAQCKPRWAHTVSPVTKVLVSLSKKISNDTDIHGTCTIPIHFSADKSVRAKNCSVGKTSGMVSLRRPATISLGIDHMLVWVPAQKQIVGRILFFQLSW